MRYVNSAAYQGLLEYVAPRWLSISYYNSRLIRNLSAILHSRMFPNVRNNLKCIGTSVCEYSMSYSPLKASAASRIMTTTGGLFLKTLI